MTSMSTVLVTVDSSETDAVVLATAAERADSLVVLHVMPLRVFEARQGVIARGKDFRYEGLSYSRSQARTDATAVARRAATSVLADGDVPYTPVGAVGTFVPAVLAAAADHGCETIVLPAERSWWRRSLGWTDRRIAKRFDGTVVRVPRPTPDNLQVELEPTRPDHDA